MSIVSFLNNGILIQDSSPLQNIYVCYRSITNIVHFYQKLSIELDNKTVIKLSDKKNDYFMLLLAKIEENK